MEDYGKKFVSFLNIHRVNGDYIPLTQSGHSVEDAAHAVGAEVADIVKNICCVTDDGRLVTVTLKGENKIDLNKVKEVLGVGKVKMATQEEVLTMTGYPCGGVPSFGYDAIFLVDPLVLDCELIYTGAGSEYSLFKTTPLELIRVSGGRVVDVKK